MSEYSASLPSALRTPHSAVGLPPSRASNPFATCWTRPGALPFVFPAGLSAEKLVARLASFGWQGEIVGPHGCGKSTLVNALKTALETSGRRIYAATLRDGQRWLPYGFLHAALDRETSALVIVDGYEQLGMLQRVWLKHRCQRASAGLLVTSHTPTGLPTLIALAPDAELVQQLVSTLCEHSERPITQADVAASHACHGSNVREIFFDLYDRYEQLRAGD